MNNVGVLKTKNESAIFNIRLSWFIYTPTENLRIVKKIRTFWHFILTLSNIAPNIVKPHKNQYFHQYHNPNLIHKRNSITSYINTKIQRKSPLLPITNFCTKFTYKYTPKLTLNFSYLESENYYFILLI